MPPVSRREALVAGLTVAAGFGGASAAPVPKVKDDSWVGKTVLPKQPDPQGSSSASGESPSESTSVLHAASWEVKTEKGTRVEVLEAGAGWWLEKSQLVPLADAVAYYTKAIADDSADVYVYNLRGWAKYLLGKPEDAVKDFDAFLKAIPHAPGVENPQHTVGYSNRGLVLAEMGKFDAALKDLDEAVQRGHRPAQLNRGWAYELKGEYKKAAADYAALVASNVPDALALNNAAWLKATCPDATVRDGKEAVKLALRACEITGNRDGSQLDTLAAAHAEAGDFSAAIKAQERAFEDKGYAKKYGDDAQKRLALYKDKRPFRTAPIKAK